MTGIPEAAASLDVDRLRADFPVLHQRVGDGPLVYLDNAATAQMPRPVLAALERFNTHDRANVHRGVHTLSQRSTAGYEAARETVRAFLGAASDREIVFTRGTSEAINLVAQTWGRQSVGAGDEIVVTTLEHHSNIVPWQMLCGERGARLRVVPIDDRGVVDQEACAALLGPKTKLLAFAHVSNALGTINPAAEMVAMARERGITTLIDGAQAVPHQRVDVAALGCDFYAFSGHKLYGPTGIGVLYGREALLRAMPPWQGGGDMIRSVSFAGTTYAEPPARFEAGTPHIAGAIGLAAAIDYVLSVGLDRVAAHEAALLAHATRRLEELPGLRLIGTAPHKAAVASFVVDGAHPHDIATLLDHEGIAVRAGHHCAEPVMDRFGVTATARASFAMYNTHAEVDALAAGLEVALSILRP